MRPTRRGLTVAGVVVLSVTLGQLFGQAALNAVAAPAAVALAVGLVQVYRADEPTVSTDPPLPGFPDERRTLSVAVEGSGLASVEWSLPDGLAGADVLATATLPHTVEREVTLRERGVYEFAPVTVTVRGPLGLVAARSEHPVAGTAVVYPRRYAVAGAGLADQFADELAAERQEFDRLREYVPGDPLRNVHWKSSAKHDDFLVMEFGASQETEAVAVAASAEDGCADEMASAAASVLELGLEAGLAVGVSVPAGTVAPGQGESHRENVLRLLARTGAGDLAESVHADADVSIRATESGTTVRTGDGSYDFDRVTTGRRSTATGVSA
jgi:uncharacterized protein (DUF58 family)